MVEKSLTITDPAGLHARPVSILVAEAGNFKSNIEIAYNDRKANLKSILSVMGLGVPANSSITLYVDGEDESHALAKLVEAFEANKVAE